MIEFYIDDAGFRIESIEALKKLIDEEMVEDVIGILIQIHESINGTNFNPEEEGLGFFFGDDKDDKDGLPRR